MPLIIETRRGRTEYPLTEGIRIIGRDPHCDVTVSDASLSRRHAEISVIGDEVILRDLNSKNGTYLGTQRVREAHLRPGVRLRAGNVWLYMKSSDESVPGGVLTHAPEAPRAEPPTPTALDSVPDDAAFAEEEEPTPIDENVARSAAADAPAGQTRLIVRDNRWFVQDSATGTEVEIVPVGRPTSPVGAVPPPAPADAASNLPALARQREMPVAPARIQEPRPAAQPEAVRTAPVTAVRSRRFYLLLGVAGLAVMLTVILLVLTGEKEQPPMTLTAYYRQVDAAIADFEDGRRAYALALLQTLQRRKVQNNPQLAEIMEKALRADARLPADFPNAWEEAQTAWENVRSSSWQSERSKELADERLLWVLSECSNMASVNDARRFAEQGNFTLCLDKASLVAADSIFREEAEALIRQTRETVVEANLEKADRDKEDRAWDAAIAALEEVLKYKPETTETLKPRIAALRQRKREAVAVEEAKALAVDGDIVAALGKLRVVGPDSPYRAEAAALADRWAETQAARRARGAYNTGNAARALKILEDAGLAQTELHSKITNVRAAFEAAEKAFREAEFLTAEEQIGKVLQLETERNNYYAAQAERMKTGMTKRKSDLAQQLLEEADGDARERRFADARRKLERVLLLDPARGVTVLDRMTELRNEAIMDYNRAINMVSTRPEEAKRLLQEVKDRLPIVDKYYKEADRQLRMLERAAPTPDEGDQP